MYISFRKRCCLEQYSSWHTPDANKTVSIIFGYFFFLNYIVGVGFLGIPEVFRNAGLLTSLLTLFVISLLSWTTITWLFEVLARAQAIEDIKNHYNTTSPHFRLEATRKFEQAELCELFVHKGFKYIYVILVSTNFLISLWANCTVAGQAWSVNLPLNFGPFNMCANVSLFSNRYVPENSGCLASYRFCVFLFALVVVPLSLLDIKKQSIVQFALSIVRFTLIGSMSLYCIVKIIENACTPDLQSNCTTIDVYSLAQFKFPEFMAAIPVILYAQNMHSGVVALSHPIKQKNMLKWMVLLVLSTTTVLYATLGTAVSLWFGQDTLGIASLNWFPFTRPGNSIQLRIFSYLIVLFPSLDVCTTYPLLVYALSNNIFLIVMGKDTSQMSYAYEWWIRLGMKAVIAVLPIMCAMFIANLLSVLTYGGLVTFFNVFFFPAVLQIASQWKCIRLFGNGLGLLHNNHINNQNDENTPLLDNNISSSTKTMLKDYFGCSAQAVYSTPYSNPGLSHPVAVLLIFLIGLTLLLLAFVNAVKMY